MISSPPQIQARQILDIVYPIGIIVEFASNVDPNDIMHGQKWRLYGPGRTTVCKDSGTFGTLGTGVGSETHTLTLAQTPSHTHGLTTCGANQYNDDYDWVKPLGNTAGGGAKASGIIAELGYFTNAATRYVKSYSSAYQGQVMSSEGGSQPHNNIQPSIVVLRYRRIA